MVKEDLYHQLVDESDSLSKLMCVQVAGIEPLKVRHDIT